MSYDHIDHPITREMLAGKTTSEADISAAIDFAEQCLQADQQNPDVQAQVYSARATALNAVDQFWQIPCLAGVIANLRVFWTV